MGCAGVNILKHRSMRFDAATCHPVRAGHEPAVPAVPQVLDDLALRGGPTSAAVRALGRLVADGAAEGSLHLPGTYPHEQWQGSRIEGFVVAQGQAMDVAASAELRRLAAGMAAQQLRLGAVAPALRRPYEAALVGARAAAKQAVAVAAAAAAKAAESAAAEPGPADGQARGSSSAKDSSRTDKDKDKERQATAAAKAKAAEDEVAVTRAAMQAHAAAWTPAAAIPHAAVPADLRDSLTHMLMTHRGGLQQQVSEAGFLGLPGGRRVYSRLALSGLSPQALQQLLAGEAAAAEAAGDAARVDALRQAEAEAAAEACKERKAGEETNERTADEEVPAALQLRAFRALAGEPDLGSSLRYKKKMMLWTMPPPAPGAAAAASGAEAQPPQQTPQQAWITGGEEAGGVIGYCLMTFVIRNGLTALKTGATTYIAYVDNLVGLGRSRGVGGLSAG